MDHSVPYRSQVLSVSRQDPNVTSIADDSENLEKVKKDGFTTKEKALIYFLLVTALFFIFAHFVRLGDDQILQKLQPLNSNTAYQSVEFGSNTKQIMGEQFLGSWKLLKSENFEDFLKELEIHYVKRKLAFLVVPTVVFHKDQNDLWYMETQTHIRTVRAEFELGNEFDELTVDDRNVKTVFSLSPDGNALVQTQINSKGIKAVISRTISTSQDGESVMKVHMSCNDVISTAVFKKLH